MSTNGASLQQLHTFHLPVSAHRVITVTTPDELLNAWTQAKQEQQAVLLLGEGSNVLFLEDFSGTVIINRIKGINVRESDTAWHLHVGAGENWHQLVCFTLDNDLAGLENLALIPGCAGSSPIQNIGAYGIELKRVCDYVDVLNLNTGEIERLSAEQCLFGYRDSIFKHKYQDGYAIVHVGLQLSKEWVPILEYGDLKKLDAATVTPKEIFDSVCAMRRSKLPDPNITGNAGSFFKNPIVSTKELQKLVEQYPDIPHYSQNNGTEKLAAGWLIDNCSLKGFTIGGAAVHKQQALVLINQGNATSKDVISVAHHVRSEVFKRFSVLLEPEVRFVGKYGEINAVEAIS